MTLLISSVTSCLDGDRLTPSYLNTKFLNPLAADLITVQGGELHVYPTGGDDTTLLQNAIALAIATQGRVHGHGTFTITSTLSLNASYGRIALVGDGTGNFIIINNITGSAADPAIKISGTGAYFLLEGLEIRGNALTGSSGNGHGIALINIAAGAGVSTFSPQQVTIRDVQVTGHLGTGKDYNNSSIPSCGIYGYGCTALYVDNTVVYQAGMGCRLHLMSKVNLTQFTADVGTYDALYLDTCDQVSMHAGILNGSGAAGTTDGLLHIRDSTAVAFFGVRMKNGNPFCVNMTGTTFTNHSVNFYACDIRQLDQASGHTIGEIGSGSHGVRFYGCDFGWVNTMTDAFGLNAIQGAGGHALDNFAVDGCRFQLSTGMIVAKMVQVAVASSGAYAPMIVNNLFGGIETLGSVTTVTSAVFLDGFVTNAVVAGNQFVAGVNVVITDAIHIHSANALYTKIAANNYYGSGTITSRVSNLGNVAYQQEEYGSTRMMGVLSNITRVIGNYTVLATDQAVSVNSTSTTTMTLPAASTVTGQIFDIQRASTGTVVVTATSGSSLNASATTLLSTVYQNLTFQSYGSGYMVK